MSGVFFCLSVNSSCAGDFTREKWESTYIFQKRIKEKGGVCRRAEKQYYLYFHPFESTTSLYCIIALVGWGGGGTILWVGSTLHRDLSSYNKFFLNSLIFTFLPLQWTQGLIFTYIIHNYPLEGQKIRFRHVFWLWQNWKNSIFSHSGKHCKKTSNIIA